MSAIAIPQRQESATGGACARDAGRARARFLNWAAVWFAALLALTVAVRVADQTGWLGSDDAAYYSAAEHILTGTPITRLHHHYARMAIIVPIAASVGLFGHTTSAVALPMFVASIVCVVLVVILGRMVWGWWEGLLAGTIVSLLPYFRILSTTAFPDVHVCTWSTAAMLLALCAVRAGRRSSFALLLGASGLAVGLAVSCKVFAVSVVFGIAFLVLQRTGRWSGEGRSERRRRLLIGAASFALGGMLFWVVEGLFYSHAANDFFFTMHAHERSQAGATALVAEDDPLRLGVIPMVRDRMTLLLHTSTSGWGILGAFFWPAVLATFLFNRAGRGLAIWGAATYLLVAFMPVSLAQGYQPYPIFHGRHILPACVPFGLCLAWSVRWLVTLLTQLSLRVRRTPFAGGRGADCVAYEGRRYGTGSRRAGITVLIAPPTMGDATWPVANTPGSDWRAKPALHIGSGVVVAVLVVGASLANPRELNGFRDRPTGRVGAAIRQIIASREWSEDRPIVMTPSTYWRYRILFPEPLRSRLRVAADPDAPAWWRDTTVDIVGRSGPLPAPDRTYLIATPRQLAGEAEPWDYDVTLPRDELWAWRQVPPAVTMVRRAGCDIGTARAEDAQATPIVMLIGGSGGGRSGRADSR